MDKRQVALARAFPILIGIVVFGAIIVFLALRTARGVQQTAALAQRFGALVEVCENGASNLRELTRIAEGDDAVDGEVALPGAAFRLVEGAWLYDGSALPAGWRAEEPEEVDVVLCLGPSQPLITTACEVDGSGAAPTRVYGEELLVRLVSVESGETLAQEALASAGEVDCWDGERVRVEEEMVVGWVRGEVGD